MWYISKISILRFHWKVCRGICDTYKVSRWYGTPSVNLRRVGGEGMAKHV